MSLRQDKILIIDFGSQYAQLIVRRVRELGIYCEIYPYTIDPQVIIEFGPKAIILSGGPESVTLSNTPRIPNVIFDLNVPILGICYGMQAMAEQLGGKVEGSIDKREFGLAKVYLSCASDLFQNIDRDIDVWMSHGDKVTALPTNFVRTAASDNTPIVVMENTDKKWYGVQFHPEVVHTPQGQILLSNFVYNIAGCKAEWTTENILEDIITKVRNQVGSEQVLLGLSGGVDSSVVSAILHKAIGKQLVCVFVDTGLMRLNEGDRVMNTFAENMGVRVIRVNAERRYFDELKGVSDPEEKRKIIGRVFVEIFDEKAIKLNSSVKFLAQGTIYPDVIESAATSTGKAHVIKSHHNVGGLPPDMKFQLLEPIRELFKDEVRKLGLALGLPYNMIYRHPFPGPGLGIRVLGEVKEKYVNILRYADDIFMQVLRKHNYYNKVSQAFAVFMPCKSVGVMGDARKYDYVIALRAVETIDFMTAQWARLPYELLEEASLRIVNEVNGISRVVYDITGKPPGTIEWE